MMPYIPVIPKLTVDPVTFDPLFSFLGRYGKVDVVGGEHTLSKAEDYYRIIDIE